MIDYAQTKVLLPNWILKQRNSLTNQEFVIIVKQYLIRYQNYQLITVVNDFAICDRVVEVKKGKNKKV